MKKPKDTGGSKLQSILDEVRKTRPPLARVIEAMTQSNTTRDNPEQIAYDIAMMMTARDERSPLKKALDYYESTEIKNQQKERVLKALKGEV